MNGVDLAWEWRDLAVTVTPEMAREFLATKANNRPISRGHVDRLKRDIVNGCWADAPNVIAFDAGGRLIDGQHRCTAIAETGTPVQCILISGFEPSTIDVLDIGRKRTLADVLAIKGELNSVSFAAVSRVAVWYCTAPLSDDFYSLTKATNTEVLRHVQDERRQANLREALRISRPATTVLSASYVGAVMYLGCAARQRWSYGEEFCAAIGTGENLSADDPRLLLRNRVMQAKAAKMTMSKKAQFLLIAKTWNAWINHRKMGRLMLGRDIEDLAVPAVDGCPRETWPEDVTS